MNETHYTDEWTARRVSEPEIPAPAISYIWALNNSSRLWGDYFYQTRKLLAKSLLMYMIIKIVEYIDEKQGPNHAWCESQTTEEEKLLEIDELVD